MDAGAAPIPAPSPFDWNHDSNVQLRLDQAEYGRYEDTLVDMRRQRDARAVQAQLDEAVTLTRFQRRKTALDELMDFAFAGERELATSNGVALRRATAKLPPKPAPKIFQSAWAKSRAKIREEIDAKIRAGVEPEAGPWTPPVKAEAHLAHVRAVEQYQANRTAAGHAMQATELRNDTPWTLKPPSPYRYW